MQKASIAKLRVLHEAWHHFTHYRVFIGCWNEHRRVRNYEDLVCCRRSLAASVATASTHEPHLAAGYGWQQMPTIMQALHRGELEAALALIDSLHYESARLSFPLLTIAKRINGSLRVICYSQHIMLLLSLLMYIRVQRPEDFRLMLYNEAERHLFSTERNLYE